MKKPQKQEKVVTPGKLMNRMERRYRAACERAGKQLTPHCYVQPAQQGLSRLSENGVTRGGAGSR